MSLSVVWTDEAKETFQNIVLYLESEWGVRETENFVKRNDQILKLISYQPYMYKSVFVDNVRQAFITSQTSMFYEVSDDAIKILFFWDNRQRPLF